MLRRLRAKFVAIVLAIVATILVAASVTLCAVEYGRSVADAYRSLDSAVAVAIDQHNRDALETDEDTDDAANSGLPAFEKTPDKESGEQSGGADGSKPEIGGIAGGGHRAPAPLALFFRSEDGELSEVAERTTASIDETVLTEANQILADSPDGHGELRDLGLLYAKRTLHDGGSFLAFADASATSSWQSLAALCAVVVAAALGALFVITLFLSRWALRPVERVWNQQQRFVADASHELKTPLTVILANTSILLEHPEASVASQSKWIESTQTEAKHMQGLVSDMLELAAPENRGKDGEPTPPDIASGGTRTRLDLADLVEGEALQFESIAFERSISIECDIEQSVTVVGSKDRIARLVATLLDNACKYADTGTAVAVRLQADYGEARLTVHNDGGTIPADELPHVFDRFYRADKARTRGVGGYGLGLAIARDIVRAHGGTITAESAEGKGTTFTVVLPTA